MELLIKELIKIIEEIDFNDEFYPKRLKNIPNPPLKLYAIGNKKILNNKGIAIVGSRDCTSKGEEIATQFASKLSESGFSIISGMAKGIDSFAHRGALESSGSTIAVLGCGVDYVYPPSNVDLYNEIVERGGVVVSEYPCGTEPTSEYFRNRNRLVSGLSLGVLIVEAEFRSGTTITASYAKKQGKDVFCIPHAIDNSKGSGTNILIQKGARLVMDPVEIVERYREGGVRQVSFDDIVRRRCVSKKVLPIVEVKEEYRGICQCLAEEPLGINDIVKKTGLDMSELYQKLFAMEIEGIVELKKNRYMLKIRRE